MEYLLLSAFVAAAAVWGGVLAFIIPLQTPISLDDKKTSVEDEVAQGWLRRTIRVVYVVGWLGLFLVYVGAKLAIVLFLLSAPGIAALELFRSELTGLLHSNFLMLALFGVPMVTCTIARSIRERMKRQRMGASGAE